jgi:hypothetical protein
MLGNITDEVIKPIVNSSETITFQVKNRFLLTSHRKRVAAVDCLETQKKGHLCIKIYFGEPNDRSHEVFKNALDWIDEKNKEHVEMIERFLQNNLVR